MPVIGLIIYLGLAAWLIYDPDALGEYTGWARGHHIDTPTPGYMIRSIGCCMVAYPPAYVLWGLLTGWGLVPWAAIAITATLGLAGAAVLYRLAVRMFGE